MPQRLTVLFDLDDLRVAEASGLSFSTVLAMDADLHAYCLDHDVAHITPWDVIDHEDGAVLARRRAAAWAWWSGHAHAVHDGLDCLQMVSYRHLRCLTRMTWVAFVVSRAIERLGAAEVVTCEAAGHGLDQPYDQRSMPLLHGVVEGVARQAGIAVQCMPRAAGFEDRTVAAAERHLPAVDPQALLGERPYILVVGNDGDLLRQLPVIAALQQAHGITVVQLFKSADDDVLARLGESTHPVWHETQIASAVATPEPGDTIPWLDRARADFERHARSVPPDLRSLFDNPALVSHYDFIFGSYARSMARHVRQWQAFFDRWRPRAVVTNYPTPLLDVACHLDIPGVVLPHGLLVHGDTALYHGLPTRARIAAVSPGHRARLSAAGIAAERIAVTGDPASMPLVAQLENQPGDPAQVGRRILLLSGHSTSPATLGRLPEVDWRAACRAFEDLADLAGRRTEWTLALKRHPRYDHDRAYYARINRRLPDQGRIALIEGPSLAAALPDADAVVIVNAMTSAIMEASAGGAPVFILDSAMLWCAPCDWGLERWPRVHTVGELERALDGVFADPGRYAACVAQTRDALTHYLGLDDAARSSVERSVELITTVAAVPALPGTRIPGTISSG